LCSEIFNQLISFVHKVILIFSLYSAFAMAVLCDSGRLWLTADLSEFTTHYTVGTQLAGEHDHSDLRFFWCTSPCVIIRNSRCLSLMIVGESLQWNNTRISNFLLPSHKTAKNTASMDAQLAIARVLVFFTYLCILCADYWSGSVLAWSWLRSTFPEWVSEVLCGD